IQYPPQTGAYAVKVKNGAGWTGFGAARFHISVGQPYHEGEKFKATMAWASQRFEKVIICVNDTLQRHNLIFDGMDEVDAFDLAEVDGREWVERNLKSIRQLPNFEIRRWEEWRTNPDYHGKISEITELHRKDRSFREEIDNEVLTFWQRRQKRTGLADEYRFADFQKNSTNYLLEECAVFSLMFKHDCAVDIYPGSTLLPCVLFKNEDALGVEAFTRIDFSRNRELAHKAA
ncbi:MAG: tRNA-dependent cyclodipeptide synthase, partial [Thiomicrorhabdus sp.]|nr:tRNA-dependent cyclodipeptide synthase [Thiomicrorhabdus sp.]